MSSPCSSSSQQERALLWLVMVSACVPAAASAATTSSVGTQLSGQPRRRPSSSSGTSLLRSWQWRSMRRVSLSGKRRSCAATKVANRSRSSPRKVVGSMPSAPLVARPSRGSKLGVSTRRRTVALGEQLPQDGGPEHGRVGDVERASEELAGAAVELVNARRSPQSRTRTGGVRPATAPSRFTTDVTYSARAGAG